MPIPTFLSEVGSLVRDTRKALKQLPNFDQEIFEQAVLNVNRAIFSYVPNEQWNSSKNYLTPTTLTAISLGASALGQIWTDKVISDQDLQSLLEKVSDLEKEVFSAEINGELKTLMLTQIEKLRLSIINYRIWGIDGIKEAVNLNIGFLLTNAEKISETKETGFLQKYYQVISLFLQAGNFGMKFLELTGGDLTKLLPPG